MIMKDRGTGGMMRLIFLPAVTLLNRMSYTRKFTLLWFMSLIAVAIVVYSLFASLDRVIQPSQRELDGLVLVEPVSRAVQAVQLHRGISAALLSGNAAMKARRAAKETHVAEAFAALEAALPSSLASGADYRVLKAGWERVRGEGLGWTMEENFAAHTRLVGQLQSLRVSIADDYALTLDGELATFYLIDTNINRLPRALEHLGQLRAYGTGTLSGRQITESRKIRLNNLLAGLDAALDDLETGIRKAGHHNPAVRDALFDAYRRIADSARKVTDIVTTDILTGRFATSPEDFLEMATAEIDKGYVQMHGSLLPTTRMLIERRIAQAENTLLTSVGGALLLFALVVYVSVSIYYAIIDSIQALVRSAHTFAAGNLDARVRLETRDEIGRIGDSFNKMADGFNALLDERKRAERELADSRERFYTIIETALDAVVQMNTEGIITGWNAMAEKMFGWPREEAIGRAMDETIIPPQYRQAHRRGVQLFLESGKAGAVLNTQVEMTALYRDGREFPVELSVVPIRTGSGYEFSAFINDITDRKQSEDMIWRQANFDELTGLPNRHMFYDRLAQETRKADRAGMAVALLYIDLDHFKEINDTLGHSMGDILLVDAARRIGACVRETDTVARLGGDEFIIVLTELDAGRIDALTQNILHELAEPFQLGSEVAYLSASVGITLYPDDADGMEELVKNADQAMYAAKNAGRNRFSYFTQAMQDTAQARLKLSNDLRGALAGRQFEVYYQPIVELETGRTRKAEALIRWRHPERGLVNPAEFIPLAEESGMIVEIGDWVFREAAGQARRWRARYDPKFQISVNMSPIQFRSPQDTSRSWPAHLQELGLPGDSMVIEITEGLLLEAEQGVMDKLRRFHEAGLEISLDDFGTGYSALSYLQKFDIDYLKIDQSFTRDLTPSSGNMALSDAIIMMARRLGMQVIAEGVETEAQRVLLAGAGCHYVQGYLFSRPLPAAAFEELLTPRSAA